MKLSKIFLTGLLTLIPFLFLAVPSWAVDVMIDPGNYTGLWRLLGASDTGWVSGVKTVALAPGNQALNIGSGHSALRLTLVRFSVDNSGTVSQDTLNDPGNEAVKSVNFLGNTLQFKSTPVDVDPGAYQLAYGGLGGNINSTGLLSLELVPNIDYDLFINFPNANTKTFRVESDGTLSFKANSLSDSVTFDHTTGPNPIIRFKNTAVNFDPDNFSAPYYLFSSGVEYTGLNSFVLVPGSMYIVCIATCAQVAGSQIVFQVNADGSIGNGHLNYPPASNAFNFMNPPSFTPATIMFKNVNITIDPDQFTGLFRIPNKVTTSPNLNAVGGVQNLILVPGVGYWLQLGATNASFKVDASGNTGPLVNTDSLIFSGSTVTFPNAEIFIEPSNPNSFWRITWVTDVLPQHPTGSANLIVVPGFTYRLTNFNGNPALPNNDVFDVASPCAINTGNQANPNALVAGGVTFTITCGVPPPPDSDGDGLADGNDNCPSTPNFDQLDQDNDGIGDVCDLDIDGDGVANAGDNCPTFSNADQADADNDGIGDVCDSDVDGDSVEDNADNCPFTPNTDQANSDGDALGNVCDPDDDNDGVLDGTDNCPLIANLDQADFNTNGIGDTCDADVDGDGILNQADQCPATPTGLLITPEGCSGGQYIALTCDPNNFINHGQFVSCVAHTANDLVDQGILTPQEKARFVNQAAKNK